MEATINTSTFATRRRAKDLVDVMAAEQQRGGIPFRACPKQLSDERPEGDYFELPHQWIEPRGK
jgi:hypothetical protein